MYRLWACLLVAFLCSSVGCESGNSDGRLAVTGSITWEGAPLADGNVSFVPIGEGLGSGARVSDGKFELAADKGLTPGEYQVKVIAQRETGREIYDPDFPGEKIKMKETEQFIPYRYNLVSKLKLVVAKGSPVSVSYDLTK